MHSHPSSALSSVMPPKLTLSLSSQPWGYRRSPIVMCETTTIKHTQIKWKDITNMICLCMNSPGGYTYIESCTWHKLPPKLWSFCALSTTVLAQTLNLMIILLLSPQLLAANGAIIKQGICMHTNEPTLAVQTVSATHKNASMCHKIILDPHAMGMISSKNTDGTL